MNLNPIHEQAKQKDAEQGYSAPPAVYEIPNAQVCYTVSDLLKVLKVSKQTLYRLINSGELKSKKVGGRRLVAHSCLMNYLERG